MQASQSAATSPDLPAVPVGRSGRAGRDREPLGTGGSIWVAIQDLFDEGQVKQILSLRPKLTSQLLRVPALCMLEDVCAQACEPQPSVCALSVEVLAHAGSGGRRRATGAPPRCSHHLVRHGHGRVPSLHAARAHTSRLLQQRVKAAGGASFKREGGGGHHADRERVEVGGCRGQSLDGQAQLDTAEHHRCRTALRSTPKAPGHEMSERPPPQYSLPHVPPGCNVSRQRASLGGRKLAGRLRMFRQRYGAASALFSQTKGLVRRPETASMGPAVSPHRKPCRCRGLGSAPRWDPRARYGRGERRMHGQKTCEGISNQPHAYRGLLGKPALVSLGRQQRSERDAQGAFQGSHICAIIDER